MKALEWPNPRYKKYIIIECLYFTKLLSNNEEFGVHADSTLVKALLLISLEHPAIDIYHQIIFGTLERLTKTTQHANSFWSEIITEAEKCLSKASPLPLKLKNIKKVIPPAFFYNLLILFPENSQLKELHKRKNKLIETMQPFYGSFESKLSERNMSIVESSDLLISISNPLDIYQFTKSIEPNENSLPLEVMPNMSNKTKKVAIENRNSLILAEKVMKSYSSINGEASSSFLTKSLLGSSLGTSNIDKQLTNNALKKMFLNDEQDNDNLELSKDNILLLSETSSNLM